MVKLGSRDRCLPDGDVGIVDILILQGLGAHELREGTRIGNKAAYTNTEVVVDLEQLFLRTRE